MFRIENITTNEIIIKNSRFICVLYPVSSLEEINNCFQQTKNTYKNATHYCSAYICNELKKANDDGEPGGTAGMPILQVLEKRKLNYILCVVVRYFGGIKLGAGGLVRAYTKSVTETLKKTSWKEFIYGYEVTIQFSYDMIKEVDYILKNCSIVSKEFKEKVVYHIRISSEILNQLKRMEGIWILDQKETYL